MCIVDGVCQSCFHNNFNLLLNLKAQVIEVLTSDTLRKLAA